MSAIVDLSSVCLICVQKDNKLHSIFDVDEQTPELPIVDKIFKCSELNFELESGKLPDKICNVCLNDLVAAWRFRENCKRAHKIFQYLQQQGENAQVMATIEVEQQQIKLPIGLKIEKLPAYANTNCQTDPKNFKINKRDSEKIVDLAPTDDDESQDYAYENHEHNSDSMNEQLADTGADEYELNTNQTEDEEPDFDDIAEGNVEMTEDEEFLYDPTSSVKDADINKSPLIEKYIKEQTQETHESGVKPIKRGRGRPKKVLADENDSTTDTSKNQNTHNKDVIYKPTDGVNERKITPGRKRRTVASELRSPKICEVCGNSYKYQHALNAHMRRHNNDRPYTCEFCEKKFVACVELQRHMRVHTGHKPYACQYCDRRFSDFGSRLKHERTHTGERPYTCGTCNKAFAYAHVLSVHMRTHTGEKRFQCQRCERGFTKKAYLLAHMEQHGGRFGCVPKPHDEEENEGVKSDGGMIIHEGNIYTTEYIVEELSEQEAEMLVVKGEKSPMKYEIEQGEVVLHSVAEVDDDLHQVEAKNGNDDNVVVHMTEEHLDDDLCDDDLVFDLR